MPKWKYKLIAPKKGGLPQIEAELNELGDDGWELFQAIPLSDGLILLLKQATPSPDADPGSD
jgi:hypothetical protein